MHTKYCRNSKKKKDQKIKTEVKSGVSVFKNDLN